MEAYSWTKRPKPRDLTVSSYLLKPLRTIEAAKRDIRIAKAKRFGITLVRASEEDRT